MNKIDVVHARLYQARACIAVIDAVLVDRDANLDGDTMTDSALQGLASAAVELLDQADEAAEGWRHNSKRRKEEASRGQT